MLKTWANYTPKELAYQAALHGIYASYDRGDLVGAPRWFRIMAHKEMIALAKEMSKGANSELNLSRLKTRRK